MCCRSAGVEIVPLGVTACIDRFSIDPNSVPVDTPRQSVTNERVALMDEAQFQDLVDRHGEDLTLWPAAVRVAAEALLLKSERARSILETAVRLREALAAGPAVRAPAGLAARIVALAEDDADKPAPTGKPSSSLRTGS